MGAQSFDDEIAQVPSRDRADRFFAPNSHSLGMPCHCALPNKETIQTHYIKHTSFLMNSYELYNWQMN